jgi:uncharacterized protein
MPHHRGPGDELSPAGWVQLFQALVARELVEGLGTSLRRTAELLGIAPSAISQYLSGKRLSSRFAAHAVEDRDRRLAREVAERLLAERRTPMERTGLLLEGARALSIGPPRRTTRGARRAAPEASLLSPGEARELVHWLRERVRSEQAAVAGCMQLAQRARDELTRAIFRQIASDSLRHAEIVASLASYLERGVERTSTTGVTREDIERLIDAERDAESGPQPAGVRRLGGTMGVLLQSMGADERKHDEILARLLEIEAAGRSEADGPARRRRARSR